MSRRGRGRGRIGTEIRVIDPLGPNHLTADLTDDAQLIAHISLFDASRLNAVLRDENGISTANLTHTNPTARNLAASLADLNGISTATLTHEDAVVPGDDVHSTPGDGDYVVPEYNTLTMTLFGGGASGGENTTAFGTIGNYNGYDATAAGNNGANTTIASLSLNAKGGLAPTAAATNNQQAGGLGQTPTGGDTNTAGNPGESNANGGGGDRGGAGGSAPSPGGAGGARITGAGNSDQSRNGNDGVAPGGGGSGDLCSVFSLSDGWHHNGAAGGASGSKLVKTYTRGDPGAPVPGDHLAYHVGAGGAAPNADPGATRSFLAGKGADGRVTFTVA